MIVTKTSSMLDAWTVLLGFIRFYDMIYVGRVVGFVEKGKQHWLRGNTEEEQLEFSRLAQSGDLGPVLDHVDSQQPWRIHPARN